MLRGIRPPDVGAHAGIHIRGGDTTRSTKALSRRFHDRLEALGLTRHVDVASTDRSIFARVRSELAAAWAPGLDTTGLAARLDAEHGAHAQSLERETLVSLLLAPDGLDFPGVDEFEAALRIRIGTAEAARRTALEFGCDERRPEECWTRDDEGRFVLRPGTCLIDALRRATQPAPDEAPHAFGCYRATEYVMLLAIAEEAARTHPELLDRLRARTERRPIQSREFHDALLREHGTMDDPLPARWFVPGDRVWFRNPDEHSADAEGYEGSWVLYLGAREFANFWQRDRPYTLERKCVEIHHWRHATWRDDAGRLRIDEDEVERRVAATMADPQARDRVLARMQRWRDPRGTYAEGGCMDRTRECARWVHPDSCDLEVPPA